MKVFWGNVVSTLLLKDSSSFKISRFPLLINFLQKFLENSFNCFYASLLETWCKVLKSFFDMEARGTVGVEVEYDFSESESYCHITWDGKKLGHLLVTQLITRGYLVSCHALQRKVYEGVECFFRGLDVCLEEEHADERNRAREGMKRVDVAVRGMLAVVKAAENGVGGDLALKRFCTNRKGGHESVIDDHDDGQMVMSDPTEELTMRSVGLDIRVLASPPLNFSPQQLRLGGYSALEAMRAGSLRKTC